MFAVSSEIKIGARLLPPHPRGRRAHTPLGLVLTIIFFFPSLSNSEVLTLHNGKRIQGQVVAETSQVVHVKTNLGVLTFRRDEIREVAPSPSTATNALRNAVEAAFSSNDVLAALSFLSENVPLEPSDVDWADQKLLDHLALIEKQYSAFPSKVVEDLSDFLTFRTIRPPATLLTAAIDMALRAEETSRAVHLVAQSVQRRWLSSFPKELIHHYFDLVRGGSPTAAPILWSPLLDSGIALGRMNEKLSPTERAFLNDISARLLTCFRVSSQDCTTEVTHRLVLYFSALSEDERRVAFNEVIRLARDHPSTGPVCLLCENLEELVRDYQLPWDISAILREHHQLLLAANNFSQANDLLNKFEPNYPDLIAELRLITEYSVRKTRLAETDQYGRYKLAKWALAMGLPKQAASEFRALAYSPTFGKAARLHLEVLGLGEDAEGIRKAVRLIREREYSSARSGLVRLLQSNRTTLLSTETNLLIGLADHLEKTSPEIQKARGLCLIQHAERLALRGDYAGASSLLRRPEVDVSNEEIRHALRSLRQRFPSLTEFDDPNPTF